MPPTNDEYRTAALHALMALEANLVRAVSGPITSRSDARKVALEMRELLARARRVLDDDTDDLDAIVERAREMTLRIFGTSGWDATETPPDTPPAPRRRRR